MLLHCKYESLVFYFFTQADYSRLVKETAERLNDKIKESGKAQKNKAIDGI